MHVCMYIFISTEQAFNNNVLLFLSIKPIFVTFALITQKQLALNLYFLVGSFIMFFLEAFWRMRFLLHMGDGSRKIRRLRSNQITR